MYKASLGKSVKLGTIIGTIILAFLILTMLLIFVVKLMSGTFVREDIMIPIFTLVFLAILNYMYGERIKGYDITDVGVTVIKGNTSELIKRDRIIEVKFIDKSDLNFSIRTFGIGGFFSYSGTFVNKKMGSMTWYITQKDSLVMLVTKLDKIIISPDNREEFLNDVKKMLS